MHACTSLCRLRPASATMRAGHGVSGTRKAWVLAPLFDVPPWWHAERPTEHLLGGAPAASPPRGPDPTGMPKCGSTYFDTHPQGDELL